MVSGVVSPKQNGSVSTRIDYAYLCFIAMSLTSIGLIIWLGVFFASTGNWLNLAVAAVMDAVSLGVLLAGILSGKGLSQMDKHTPASSSGLPTQNNGAKQS